MIFGQHFRPLFLRLGVFLEVESTLGFSDPFLLILRDTISRPTQQYEAKKFLHFYSNYIIIILDYLPVRVVSHRFAYNLVLVICLLIVFLFFAENKFGRNA